MLFGGGLPPRVPIPTPPKKVDVFLYWTYRFPRHRDRDKNKIFLKTKILKLSKTSKNRGFQISKMIDGKRYWRIPVMDGEFLTQEKTGVHDSVGGGNFLVLAESQAQALAACEAAIEEMRKIPNVIMPFPGGVVRSGSKVGSKFKALNASTNDAFCPTLKGQTKSDLSPEVESVMEIVIDGLTKEDIDKAMRVGIQAVCDLGAENGIRRISAGNYGGKLGPYHFHLQEIMA